MAKRSIVAKANTISSSSQDLPARQLQSRLAGRTITDLTQHPLGHLYRDVLQDGETIVRLEYFLEHDPANASMWNCYARRVQEIQNGEFNQWSTYVADSLTYMEMTARMFGKKLNPPPKFDQRHWFGYSTDQLEQMCCMGLASLPINVVLLCHTGEDKDELHGTFVRSLHAPGRLGKFRGLGAGYAEVYRAYVGADENGNKVHQLQTHTDNLWAAETQIDAPDPCYPTYEDIWINWGDRDRDFIHAICYGDIGSGKSTFARTFPTPMLVHMFDPFGKDRPYLK